MTVGPDRVREERGLKVGVGTFSVDEERTRYV